jgi:hypothetical protein
MAYENKPLKPPVDKNSQQYLRDLLSTNIDIAINRNNSWVGYVIVSRNSNVIKLNTLYGTKDLIITSSQLTELKKRGQLIEKT